MNAGEARRTRRWRLFGVGSPRAWAITLGALAVLSFAAAIPLSVLSGQVANGVIAAVIGVPSAAIGMLVIRRGAVQPVAAAGAARGGPPVQPGQV